MSKICVIFGAPDPEAAESRRILDACGVPHAQATCGGRPVHPGNAYRADGTDRPVPEGADAWLFECGGDGLPPHAKRFDHHRPGDPGFGAPPEDFLPASSIGQMVSALAASGDLEQTGWPHSLSHPDDDGPGAGELDLCSAPETDPWWRVGTNVSALAVPTGLLLVAAADHCLRAAYAGECPGVSPEWLADWRIKSRAKFQGRSVADVESDIGATAAALRRAECICMDPDNGVYARSMMRKTPWPELPEAAARVGESYIAGPLSCPDGRKKVVCAGTPDVIRSFMSGEGLPFALRDVYGDPVRGFAGGYLD